jgi:hypothetical protein
VLVGGFEDYTRFPCLAFLLGNLPSITWGYFDNDNLAVPTALWHVSIVALCYPYYYHPSLNYIPPSGGV